MQVIYSGPYLICPLMGRLDYMITREERLIYPRTICFSPSAGNPTTSLLFAQRVSPPCVEDQETVLDVLIPAHEKSSPPCHHLRLYLQKAVGWGEGLKGARGGSSVAMAHVNGCR